MKRWVAIAVAWLLASGCSYDGLLDSSTDQVRVCVDGDAGRCCIVMFDVCRIGEEECMAGDPLARSPSRCVSCAPWELEDGGVADAPMQPPNPPADAPIAWTDDAGVHSAYTEVCGPASYERYTTN